jgi:ankyrin repeat protein
MKYNFKTFHLFQMSLPDACRDGDIERVKRLLEKGEDPTVDWNAAIRLASFNGHTKVVEILLQDGRADPTADENAALGYASYHGNVEIVKALLKDGRVNPEDDDSYAIEIARTDEIREMLIAYKYRVDGEEYQRLREQIKK